MTYADDGFMELEAEHFRLQSKKALIIALSKKHKDCVDTITLLIDLLAEERERLDDIERLLKDISE